MFSEVEGKGNERKLLLIRKKWAGPKLCEKANFSSPVKNSNGAKIMGESPFFKAGKSFEFVHVGWVLPMLAQWLTQCCQHFSFCQ